VVEAVEKAAVAAVEDILSDRPSLISKAPVEHPYTIVAGISFDESGELALREALRIAARQPTAVIHAVHVVKPAAGLRKTRSVGRLAKDLERDGDSLFGFVFSLIEREPVLADERLRLHTLVGTPTEALIQHTIDTQADLLVVGTHGRKGLSALVLGSIAQDLVARARCPVLVARPRVYDGAPRTDEVEPLCADCADMRAATDGKTLWCEWHSRPHVRAHTYGDADRVGLPYNPGIVSSG